MSSKCQSVGLWGFDVNQNVVPALSDLDSLMLPKDTLTFITKTKVKIATVFFSHAEAFYFDEVPFVYTLLVGMQTGVATVENSVEFPQKTKSGTAL